MSIFQLRHPWMSAGTDLPEMAHTMCRLEMQLGDVLLTQHEDIFSQTISDAVLVSAYPLAHWFAANWWRLTSEPLPPKTSRPLPSWRLAHEMGAASSGYVWPQVLFATDREVMQVWAVPSRGSRQQSVRYLNGLATPMTISMHEFKCTIEIFINAVIARLTATGLADTDLKSLWAEVMEERTDAKTAFARRYEAELGYDPDECPTDVLKSALELAGRMGESALSELAPVYGKAESSNSIHDLNALIENDAILGSPNLPDIDLSMPSAAAPWERAVKDARVLRGRLGTDADRISTDTLCALLGIRKQDGEQYISPSRNKVAIGIPRGSHHIALIPRKRHPTARRFELARFVGDILYNGSDTQSWLASTDLSTSRQKYQRAFAAEFLCPVDRLSEFLNGDFSENNLEDAAEHFDISLDSVNSLLANNNYIYRGHGMSGLPYALF